MLPVVRRPDEAPVGVIGAARWSRAVPGQRGEALLALLDERARHRARPLEANVHVAAQHELDVAGVRPAHAQPIARLAVAPGAELAAVVEDRFALEGELHLAVHA